MGKLVKVLTLLAIPVAIFAIVAITGRHLFLKVPKIGFILYAIAGGPVPPIMDPVIFARQKEWLKTGDVVVSVPMKSGTTWMMYTVNLMRCKGNLHAKFREIYEEVPWAEMVHYPGETVEERIAVINNVSRRYPYNVLKTHFAPPILPFRDDVKYVVCFRNPFDAAASLRTFFQNVAKIASRVWGGFPPGAGDQQLSPEEDWQHMLLVDGGDGKPFLNAVIVDAFRTWWPLRNKPNVLFIHYSDRIKDDVSQLKRLNTFLDLKLTESQVDEMARRVSFQELKNHASVMEIEHVYEPFVKQGLLPEKFKLFEAITGNATLMNAGPSRVGIEVLPAKLRQGIDAILDKDMTADMKQWFLKGGPVPSGA